MTLADELNVLPSYPSNNELDGGRMNTEQSRQFIGSNPARAITPADVEYLVLGELRKPISLARAWGSQDAVFPNRILHVVRPGAQEQMRRVYTETVVAVMAHVEAVRNRTASKFPRNMGGDTLPALNYDLAVPVTTRRTSPHPAVIGASLIHFGPETVSKAGSVSESSARLTAIATTSASLIWHHVKSVATRLANKSDSAGILGMHFWSLLTGSGVSRLGGFQSRRGFPRASIIPYFSGISEVTA